MSPPKYIRASAHQASLCSSLQDPPRLLSVSIRYCLRNSRVDYAGWYRLQILHCRIVALLHLALPPPSVSVESIPGLQASEVVILWLHDGRHGSSSAWLYSACPES